MDKEYSDTDTDRSLSEQDNYVVFLQPSKAAAKSEASLELHRFVMRQRGEQKWLLVAGLIMVLAMMVITANTVYTIIQASEQELFEVDLTTDAPSHQNSYSPLPIDLHDPLSRSQNDNDFEVNIVEVVVGQNPELPIDLHVGGEANRKKTLTVKKGEADVYMLRSDQKLRGRQGGNCSIPVYDARFDCFPGVTTGLTQNACYDRDCCWDPTVPPGVPFCFYPLDFPSYTVDSKEPIDLGFSLRMSKDTPSKWQNEVKILSVDVMYETKDRLRFRIYDPGTARYEVPLPVPKPDTPALNPNYQVVVPEPGSAFSLRVMRLGSEDLTLFDTTAGVPLVFSDQFIQISTNLGSNYVYGLGEHRGSFLQSLNWTKLAFWTRDQPPELNLNLYGDHPFFMGLDSQGAAYGVFLMNSNAMQVDLQPKPALTYKTIGGILDFYVFTGPRPDHVLRQYTDVIGRPVFPPYWGLGFHLCKYGYGSADEVKKVIARNRASKIPYDTQWNDIDYMRAKLDWTFSKENYAGLADIVQDLHDNGQHYIMIVDPGISSNQSSGSYPPYDEGIQSDLFIKKADGSGPLIGKVWPGMTAFPDFFHPSSQDWWFRQAQKYHSQIPFDGMWIDMNEPSSFVDGSVDGCPGNSSLDYPPWIPSVDGGSLISKTICPSAVQYLSTHYNLHSMYGFSESRASHMVLEQLLAQRSVVITRSTFPGTGRYAGHWLGDNLSSWADLYYSIPGILNFQLFGIPFVGADICGFRGVTTPELCTRWMQLGSFYPFMRNHNDLGQKDQDPGVFNKTTQDNMRKAVEARYNMLPYLYTLFYFANVNGSSVARPLWFEFPNAETYTIDRQFLWGDKLLISPVLSEGATSVLAYIPSGVWYDYYSGAQLKGQDSYQTLNAPIDVINLHLRGGAIIPTQPANVTTTVAKKQKYGLLVGLSESGTADGELFIDDGNSLKTVETNSFTFLSFSVSNNKLIASVSQANFMPENGLLLGRCRVMGLPKIPGVVLANGVKVPFTFNSTLKVLDIDNLSLDMASTFNIEW